jgi:alkanesulfonate monooxygenase SsuD/methylene tetrahydromethanopterin reductase-like flavin-dependent oxidoreductase (luciferase family)
MQAWGGAVGQTPGQRYQAFKEYAEIMRGMWDHASGRFSYSGGFYKVGELIPGPAPAHPIPLWFGAGGPRMLRLTGRMADGWLVGTIYVPPQQLPEVNRLLDEGAAQAGRNPSEVRRGYNLFGAIKLRTGENYQLNRPGLVLGTPAEWVETLVRYHLEYRHDTFIFWPVAGDEEAQIKVFLNEIMPEVRKQIREIQEKEAQAKSYPDVF